MKTQESTQVSKEVKALASAIFQDWVITECDDLFGNEPGLEVTENIGSGSWGTVQMYPNGDLLVTVVEKSDSKENVFPYMAITGDDGNAKLLFGLKEMLQ